MQTGKLTGVLNYAGGNAPYIGENGHWYIYDPASHTYIDSGRPGQGPQGYTFIPTVSPEGIISWSNNGALPNPEAVDIKGPPGEKGNKGDKGDTGEGLEILGYYSSAENLISSVPAPSPGDAYGVGTSMPYDIYIWDGVGSAWVNNGPLAGTGGGSEASVTAYTVTLSASGWTADGDRYTQSVSVPTASALSTNAISCIPHDGAKDWGYDIIPETQAAGTVTFSAGYLPADDLLYDIIVTDASTVYVDAVAVHNADPGAHANIELEVE